MAPGAARPNLRRNRLPRRRTTRRIGIIRSATAASTTEISTRRSSTSYEDSGAALARWKDRLSEYVDLQGTLDALRLRPSSEQPWPAFDNPMLGYLKERTGEIVAKDGLEAAITWLAANSWFEGAIAERSRFIRLLDAD